MTMTPDEALSEVGMAAQSAATSQEQLKLSVLRAKEAGAEIAAIARAAGVTRQTAYKWADGFPGVKYNVRQEIDRGLTILASHGNISAAKRIGGRGVIIGALAAWKTGIQGLPWDRIDEAERATLREISAVLAEAQNAKDRTGEYPEWVVI